MDTVRKYLNGIGNLVFSVQEHFLRQVFGHQRGSHAIRCTARQRGYGLSPYQSLEHHSNDAPETNNDAPQGNDNRIVKEPSIENASQPLR